MEEIVTLLPPGHLPLRVGGLFRESVSGIAIAVPKPRCLKCCKIFKMASNPSPDEALKRKRGRPHAGPAYDPKEAANLDRLLGKRGWTIEKFYERFRMANPRETISIGHFRKLITPNGQRKPLRPTTRSAIACTFGHASEIFDEFLKTGDFSVFDRPVSTVGVSENPLTDSGDSKPRDFFADCLMGVSITELRGTDGEKNTCLVEGLQRIKKHPDDVFLRAVITWAALRCGTPEKVHEAVKSLSEYLAQQPSGKRRIEINSGAWHQTIEKIKHKATNEPQFLRWHLEDALGRASLIYWLKYEGSQSALAQRISSIAQRSELPPAIAAIFSAARGLGIQNWIYKAIEEVYAWIDREGTSGLGYSLLLLLTARQGDREALPRLIARLSRWLDQHPRANDTIVRSGLLWLVSMDDCHVDQVFQQTLEWLQTPLAEDDRFVRTSLFYLAGTKGSLVQVDYVDENAANWFLNPIYKNDGCLRVTWLLWLMRRARERGIISMRRFQEAVSEIKQWQKENNDPLVALALLISEQYAAEDNSLSAHDRILRFVISR